MKKLIIVGAGASGLAAASRLIQRGFNPSSLTILEAQNRIGGRVHTINEGGNQLEMGAQWVHGEDGNVVFSIASAAKELNTHIKTLQSSGLAEDVVFSFEDYALTKTQVGEFVQVLDAIRVASEKELVEWNQSLGEYYLKKFDEHLGKGDLSSLDRSTVLALVDYYHLMENCIDGSDDWLETCGRGHLHYRECGGDPLVTWKRGYSSLFDILMKEIPKCENGLQLPLSDRIFLNKPVRNIEWETKDKNVVKLTCEDGSFYTADFVLVTCSLGFLKANADRLFSPILPPQKKRAIEGLGFGTVDKIYLKFQHPWWTSNWGGVSFLRRRKDDSGKTILSKEWSDNVLGFYTVRLQPNILVVWITGNAARHSETLPDNEVLRVCSDKLKKFIRNEFAYTEPTKVIRSKWSSNPFICGSYSFRSNKSREMNVWASDLAEPVYDSSGIPRIFFSGEATHDHFYSTVHGAVETGWREGNRIAKYCNCYHTIAKL